MFRQIFQFLNLISLKDLPKAKDHYLDIEVIKHYQAISQDGLFPDELETLDFWKNSNVENVLIVGAGAGREAQVFSNYCQNVICFEPSPKMYEGLNLHSKIKFISSLNHLDTMFDIIFVSAFVLNFMTHKERNEFYDLAHGHLKKSYGVCSSRYYGINNPSKFQVFYCITFFKNKIFKFRNSKR